jgi:hypothetical protein
MDAEVLFEYEKSQDDELDLEVGEVIYNVKEVDDGWCEGTKKNGKMGMFPDNFVKLRPVTTPPAAVSRPAAKAPPPDPTPSDPPVVVRSAGLINKTRRAKVSFSYAAENTDELSLMPGQTVDVLGEEEDGWWRGKLGDKVGLFPSNFVEVINEEPPDSAPLTNPREIPDGPPQQLPERRHPPGVGVNMGLPMFNPLDVKLKPTARVPPPTKMEEPPRIKPELKKTVVLPPKNQQTKPPAAPPPQEPPVERAKVIFQYKSEQEDELNINVGDVLEVVNKTGHDGWWKVKLGGRVGVVPDNFVELLPLEQLPAPDLPPAKKGFSELRKPPPPPAQDTPEHQPAADFGVPSTEPLDSSAIKERPHRPGGVRPPSRSNNLHQEEGESASSPGGGGEGEEAPWQREIKQRKKKEPVKLPPSKSHPPPPATVATEPEKPAPPRMPRKPSLATKPKPPPVKLPVDIAKVIIIPISHLFSLSSSPNH